jgi:hypothetical protein
MSRLFNARDSNDEAECSEISNRIDEGVRRREKEFVRAIFDLHKDKKTGVIPTGSLEMALADLAIHSHLKEVVQVFQSRRLKEDSGLDFDEFYSLLTTSSSIEEWVRALPLAELVADALPRDDSCTDRDQLCKLSNISSDQLERCCRVVMKHLEKILRKQLEILKEAKEVSDNHSNENQDKFQMHQAVEMRVGNIGDFHEGLAKRVGNI